MDLEPASYCTLAPEDTFDHSIWGCCNLCNEMTKLRPMNWVGWIKAEISRMFADFSTQLSL